jgi:hypothetical protein
MLNSDSFEECAKTQVLRRCPGERKENSHIWVVAWKRRCWGLSSGKSNRKLWHIGNSVNKPPATMKEIEVVLELGLIRSRTLGLRYDQGNVLLHWIRC